MKKTIRLNEADLRNMIMEAINELDWKTYANAAKKRFEQNRNNPDRKLWNKGDELADMANKRFHDTYVGNFDLDTLGDRMRHKHSPKFSAYLYPIKDKLAYGAVKGTNKGGDEMMSTGKGKYFSGRNGYMSPKSFFRDSEVADSFMAANDELWDYQNGNYEYIPGNGWTITSPDDVTEAVRRTIADMLR